MRGSSEERHLAQDSRDGDPGDDHLLHAISGGDREAFKRLMTRHARPMLALATRITRNADDADEIVQEVFLKVWATASKWRPDGKAKFATWLYRVVLNACLDRGRRKSFSPLEDAGDPPDPAPAGLDVAMARQRDGVLAEIMGEMPPRQRQALSLYYFSDLSAPQAADVLDLSVSALEALLVRGKRTLKAALLRRGVMGIGDLT
ncbi:RNA polymerase sigma factor [Candidatus Terasakiella magnetica]|nr:RNA polymerase sigma factor [Candidatus Terasakiella magnetica]